MEFKLIGKIVLNRVPEGEELIKAIEDFIKEAEHTILSKGAPDGRGATITDWKIQDDFIQVTIESGQHIACRPISWINFLAELL